MRRFLSIALAYLAMAIVVTFPLVLHLNSAVVGDLQSDVWKHLWGFWWVHRCLIEQHTLPLYTDLLNAPYGGSLFFIDPLGALLSLPLQALLGTALAYNLLVLFNMVLGACGAYALARYFAKNGAAAFVAGTIYGFSPYLLSNVTSGISESFNIGWLPLFMLAWVRTLRLATVPFALRSGVLLGVCTLGCWYYGVFAVMFAVFYFIYYAAGHRRQWMRLLRPVALAAVVTACIVFPFAFCFKQSLNQQFSMVYRTREPKYVDLYLSEEFHNMCRLVDYLTPGKENAVRTYTVDRLTRVPYAGWLVASMALLGALLVRRRGLGWWLGTALLATVLSLGPFLYITTSLHTQKKFWLYMALYNFFPWFSQISIPFRFALVSMLGLGMLSAYFLGACLRHRPLAYQRMTAAAVSLAVVAEFLLCSPLPYPLPQSDLAAPTFLTSVAAEPDSFAVVDFPIQRVNGELLPGEYFYYQMQHHHPIPNRVEGEIPLYVLRNPFLLQLFHLEHDYAAYANATRDGLRKGVSELRKFHFKYLIVHENLLRPQAAERVHTMLRYFLGTPRRYEDNITVYEVKEDDPRISANRR